MTARRTALLAVAIAALHAAAMPAQLAGAHPLQFFGLKAGTQPPPGGTFEPRYMNWNVNRLVTGDGRSLTAANLDINTLAFFGWAVLPDTLFGATYGFQFILPLVGNSLEAPRFGYDTHASLGLSDIYVQPINLGWHTGKFDYMAGFAFYAPTGTYRPWGNSNRGMGMWSFELSGGATYYFDDKKEWHASAMSFFETHTNKIGQDLQVGDIVTVEGGAGGTFLKGALTAGLVYGGQWKVSDDGGIAFPSNVISLNKNEIYTLGPEVTYVAYSSLPWTTSVTLRYLWDLGARSSFEGQRAFVFISLGRAISAITAAPH